MALWSLPVLRPSVLCILAWTLLGLFMFSQAMTQRVFVPDPYPWWHHFISWMIGIYLWCLLTPLILWLGRRFPFERRRVVRWTATHLLLAVAVALLQLGVESAILSAIGVFPGLMSSFLSAFVFLMVIGFHHSVMVYFTVIAVQYGVTWYRQYQERKQEALRLELHSSELQKQLVEAQLSALKMQLQPHFLFNTLNAIMVLVRQARGREAEQMIARLSDLLRCVLDDVEAREVPLRRELEYLQLYLSIEEVRFQDRLRVSISVDPQALDAETPHMILQPIVENAIRHGIERSSSAGKIDISARRAGDTLQLRVRDDGPGLNTENSRQPRGIGLANTRARLHQLYGERASLILENGERGGVAVTIVLPWRIMSPAADAAIPELHAVEHSAG